MRWNAVIFGPENTPWDGGTFRLVLEFTEDYPNKAPNVKFVSEIFHPNGERCQGGRRLAQALGFLSIYLSLRVPDLPPFPSAC